MKYFFANWKMYLGVKDSLTLAESLSGLSIPPALKAAIFPNTLAFTSVRQALPESTWSLGSQNVAWAPQGAYTGATSAFMFKEAGAAYALVGHSERRYIFNEGDDDARKKIEACFEVGLIPVLCVGETKEDKEAGKGQYRIKKQLTKAFEGLVLHGREMVIAYEPVWAISKWGAGEPCVPADADDVHGWIQLELKQYTDQKVPVIYGGSVDEHNVLSYVERDTIDGVLVGRASSTEPSCRAIIEQLASL